jgi:hypothetical protein
MAKFTIKAAEGFTGESVGVLFNDGIAEVDSDTQWAQLNYFRQAGYGVEPAEGAEGSDEEPPAAFDPGEHTVVEVNAHLDAADAAERERVLDAELGGNARAGVLNGPHGQS